MGIRQAEQSDLAAVRAIVEAAYGPWVPIVGVRPRPMDADYPALVAGGLVHVLENGEVDALIVLHPEPGALLVENVAVRPDRQGRGLGRRLMAFAEFRARSLGLSSVRLYTHEKMISNIGLYTSLGYVETGREGPIVHMSKVVSTP